MTHLFQVLGLVGQVDSPWLISFVGNQERTPFKTRDLLNAVLRHHQALRLMVLQNVAKVGEAHGLRELAAVERAADEVDVQAILAAVQEQTSRRGWSG